MCVGGGGGGGGRESVCGDRDIESEADCVCVI